MKMLPFKERRDEVYITAGRAKKQLEKHTCTNTKQQLNEVGPLGGKKTNWRVLVTDEDM